MARESHDCPHCKAPRSLYQTSSVPDESSSEHSIGWSRQVTYSCMECNARFVVKETRKVIKVKDSKAPKWLLSKYLKKN